MPITNKPVIAISSCLLGNRVRYDGELKAMPDIVQHFQLQFHLLAVCPEVEIGLGVPRPAVQLTGNPQHPHMTGRDDTSIDVTKAMNVFCNTQPPLLNHICGYIFKSKSPSCGLRNIPVFQNSEIVEHNSQGMFAHAMSQYNSSLPMADETELNTAGKRHHFLKQLLNYIEYHPDYF
jgi:uncharacterized protein YbbK (DUF523 family)